MKSPIQQYIMQTNAWYMLRYSEHEAGHEMPMKEQQRKEENTTEDFTEVLRYIQYTI